MAGKPGFVERRSGVTLWRQIADRIRASFINGQPGSERLPPETDLAERFGVNRHTVRAAVASLVHEGVLRSEQGRGTFIVRRNRISYPIRKRTRFSSGLKGQAGNLTSTILSHETEPSPADIAAKLAVEPGTPVIRIDLVSLADGQPLSVSTHWFDAARFGALPDAIARTGSVTAGLAACGLVDYLRSETVVEAGHAEAGDLDCLQLAPGAIVLITRSVNADSAGRPFQRSVTRFAADRVSLVVDHGTAMD